MNYAELRGRIKARYGEQGSFAAAMGMDPSTLSMKLTGKSEWYRPEIVRACELLDIPIEEVHLYFFTV